MLRIECTLSLITRTSVVYVRHKRNEDYLLKHSVGMNDAGHYQANGLDARWTTFYSDQTKAEKTRSIPISTSVTKRSGHHIVCRHISRPTTFSLADMQSLPMYYEAPIYQYVLTLHIKPVFRNTLT